LELEIELGDGVAVAAVSAPIGFRCSELIVSVCCWRRRVLEQELRGMGLGVAVSDRILSIESGWFRCVGWAGKLDF